MIFRLIANVEKQKAKTEKGKNEKRKLNQLHIAAFLHFRARNEAQTL